MVFRHSIRPNPILDNRPAYRRAESGTLCRCPKRFGSAGSCGRLHNLATRKRHAAACLRLLTKSSGHPRYPGLA
ncbi:hypothetical protein AXX16_4360 [Serratia rubidaea]|nr:hypothetical protein AXX16_4360 [Serratia rubidaea]